MSKLLSFLRDVRAELAKVSWPSGSQTATYTAIVIAVSIVVALFLGVLDAVFTDILQRIIS